MKFLDKYFKQPDALTIAKKELVNAHKSFLESKTHTEYYTALAEFESVRIKRLEQYIKDLEKKNDSK